MREVSPETSFFVLYSIRILPRIFKTRPGINFYIRFESHITADSLSHFSFSSTLDSVAVARMNHTRISHDIPDLYRITGSETEGTNDSSV
jgi:hypothetical protein